MSQEFDLASLEAVKIQGFGNVLLPKKKIWVLATATLLVFSLIFPSLAGASSVSKKKGEITSIRRQISDLDKNLIQLAQGYNTAWVNLVKVEGEMRSTQARLDEVEQELQIAQKILNDRVNVIYRNGDIDFIEVLFGAENFRGFMTRLDLLKRISEEDAETLEKVREIKAEVERRREELAQQREREKAQLNVLKSKRDDLDKKLRQLKSLLSTKEGQLIEMERRARRKSVSYSSARYSIAGFAFPILGPNAFTNSWLAPRSRGRRHQGCDVFALRGTPCVACMSGTIGTSYSRLGGKTIYLYGDDGHKYAYMHLSGYAMTGGRVNKGDVIGYVGNTGNARGGSCHLHFEVHPNGGSAVNPYPILQAAR